MEKKLEKQGSMCIGFDLEKAFDTVSIEMVMATALDGRARSRGHDGGGNI